MPYRLPNPSNIVPPGKRLPTLILLVFGLIFAVVSPAQVWNRDYMQWSRAEALRIYSNSPWVSLVITGIRRSFTTQIKKPDLFRDFEAPPGDRVNGIASSYRVRLLTATPMRQAYLRLISLAPEHRNAVAVSEIMNGSNPELEQLRLARFISANPRAVSLVGSDTYIIVSIVAEEHSYFYDRIQGRLGSAGRRRVETRPKLFMSLQLSDLKETTFLLTKTGKRIPLADYQRPGLDGWGAKFYFPRSNPDGSPSVSVEDKELRFESSIGERRIEAKFKLKKLLYKGKLDL